MPFHRNPIWGLDFDGTLVSLNSDPKKVRLSAAAIKILKKLSSRWDCAIVSGRKLDDLLEHIPLRSFHFIGNHGSQVLTREGRLREWASDTWKHWRSQHLKQVSFLVQEHGGWLEDKFFSLALHFKDSDPIWWHTGAGLELAKLTQGSAELLSGTWCWNIVPKGAPTKGEAFASLCRETQHDSMIYFGDEATDETVFQLKDPPLFGVKVGEGPTLASYRLPGPKEVLEVLKRFS